MSPREDFAAALRTAVGDTSVRALASRAGWARSTIQDWLGGVRVPLVDRLKDLLDAVGSDADTGTSFSSSEQRRNKLAADPPDPPQR